jgi:uncharacterized protein (DUF433 family)
MAYSAQLAAALSGNSMRQLAYWRSSVGGGEALLRPEYAAERRNWYSFQDVLALRTFAYLRAEVSLQKIRRAVTNLRDLGNRDHLAAYRLVGGENTVVWVDGSEFVDLVQRPGQQVMAQMSDVLRPFTNRLDHQVLDLFEPLEQVRVDPDVLAGHPVVRGTRIPVEVVAGLVADGLDPSQVREYYPGVSASAARDAVEFTQYLADVAAPVVA